MSKLGLVATVLPERRLLLDWLRYHLRIGFERVYLFIDGDSPACATLASELEAAHPGRVSARLMDAALTREWATLEGAPQPEELAGRVYHKQMLNVPLAARAALADGVDWLLHIDLDELFYPEDGDLAAAFAVAPEVEQILFPNDEVMPTAVHAELRFADHPWFKRNPHLVSHFLIITALAAYEKPFYFLGYANGKSAFRVTPERGARPPAGVHGHDPAEVPAAVAERASVLHYAFASFDLFSARFSDRARLHDQHGTAEFRDSFYGWATRTFAQAEREGLGQAWLEQQFERVVVFGDPARNAQLADSELIRRLDPWRMVGAAEPGGDDEREA